MTRTRIALFTAAALALLGLACGSPGVEITGDNPPATGTDGGGTAVTARTVKVGQALTVRSDIGDTTWTVKKVATDAHDDLTQTPTGGRKYLSVLVNVRMTGEGSSYVDITSISVVTAAGQVLTQTFAHFDNRKDLPPAELRTGQFAEGWVFFEATPAELKGAKLQLKQLVLFGETPVGYWTL